MGCAGLPAVFKENVLNFSFKPVLKPSCLHWACLSAECGAHPCSVLGEERMLRVEMGFRQAAAAGGRIRYLPFSFSFYQKFLCFPRHTPTAPRWHSAA